MTEFTCSQHAFSPRWYQHMPLASAPMSAVPSTVAAVHLVMGVPSDLYDNSRPSLSLRAHWMMPSRPTRCQLWTRTQIAHCRQLVYQQMQLPQSSPG
eukprot:791354-Amphidinium_carterae.1